MTSAERWACDTSVAVASLDPTHEAHSACRRVVVERRPALAGHAAFETYSVLTRRPPPLRITGVQAAAVLADAFPELCWLVPGSAASILARLADAEVVGGSVYDALVGLAAGDNAMTLLTRDRRAQRTYDALHVEYQFVT